MLIMNFATKDNFYALCTRSGLPEKNTTVLFEDVITKYTEVHRYYHNLKHIERSLGLHSDSGVPDDSIELAIWFHHVIYDPKIAHNERKSADYFESHFDHYLWQETLAEVERLIMATDPHMERRGTNREDLMVDLDLSILGSDATAYEKYASSLRKEHSFVSDSEYNQARIEILKGLLEKQIFTTERFMMLEDQARLNINKELKVLNTLN